MTTTAPAIPQLRGETGTGGRFERQQSAFTERIGEGGLPAEAGRYHLYACLACPWAHRQLIVLHLRGLTEVVTSSLVDPIRDERGWAFTDGFEDPVNGLDFLAEAYRATDPDFAGRVTVPCIWDRERGRMATNDFRVIDVQLDQAFAALASGPELYPAPLREEIDAHDERLYPALNNGVYRAGFATTQDAYEEAFDDVFGALDELERRLASRRYLCGRDLTLADIRAYTTLVRFDAVYVGHFKRNLRRVADYPNLSGYLRDLYQQPAFTGTTDLDQIKRHYYGTHEQLNPSGIVPKGPALDLDAPHDRAALA